MTQEQDQNFSNEENINIFSNVESLELYSDSHPFRLSLRIENFDSETEYKKFVKNCELLIRRCNEYKLWKEYIVDILQVNSCMITHEEIGQVTIEVHHHIPSLFTLVCALVNKKIETNEAFCSFDIAQEAIELHFKNKVGYTTLIKTMHEKFHNGHLEIPIELVKGDYRWFIREYSKYLDEDDINTINSRLAAKHSNVSWSKDNYPAAAEA
jgi:hypothetical protein